jgi:hypothetical protein
VTDVGADAMDSGRDRRRVGDVELKRDGILADLFRRRSRDPRYTV